MYYKPPHHRNEGNADPTYNFGCQIDDVRCKDVWFRQNSFGICIGLFSYTCLFWNCPLKSQYGIRKWPHLQAEIHLWMLCSILTILLSTADFHQYMGVRYHKFDLNNRYGRALFPFYPIFLITLSADSLIFVRFMHSQHWCLRAARA